MKLLISDSRTVRDIEREFELAYPYLKIEFFFEPSTSQISSGNTHRIQSNESLGTIRNIHRDGILIASESKTIKELKNEFANDFGLFIKIYRKVGSAWIEPTLTEDWTLALQNLEGYEMSLGSGNSGLLKPPAAI